MATLFIRNRNNYITYYSGKGQVKFLIVAVDYFTKWIEAKPLTTITAQQV